MITNGNSYSNVLAVIAEYNPFHNGHLNHLKKSIDITNSEFVIALMSGNFVQRAEPAIIDKWARAEMALSAGCNLVIELPSIFAISAAEDFAFGAIKLLSDIKVVDFLSFGSKSGDIRKLETLADIFIEEPEDFMYYLDSNLKEGVSYSKAINDAIKNYLRSPEYVEILNDPNNILAIEYIKQIKKQQFSVTAITVKREDSDHNSKELSDFASGTSIREAILSSTDISHAVPKTTFEIIESNKSLINTLSNSAYESILFYKIRKMSMQELKDIKDVTEGIENRIKKAAYISASYDELIENIASKRYTNTKVRRILLNILLDITKKDIEIAKKSKSYIRVLAFDDKGKYLISKIAEANPKLDIIVSVSAFEKNNRNREKKYILGKDILATDIYALSIKPFLPAGLDYTQKVLYLDNDTISKKRNLNRDNIVYKNSNNYNNNNLSSENTNTNTNTNTNQVQNNNYGNNNFSNNVKVKNEQNIQNIQSNDKYYQNMNNNNDNYNNLNNNQYNNNNYNYNNSSYPQNNNYNGQGNYQNYGNMPNNQNNYQNYGMNNNNINNNNYNYNNNNNTNNNFNTYNPEDEYYNNSYNNYNYYNDMINNNSYYSDNDIRNNANNNYNYNYNYNNNNNNSNNSNYYNDLEYNDDNNNINGNNNNNNYYN